MPEEFNITIKIFETKPDFVTPGRISRCKSFTAINLTEWECCNISSFLGNDHHIAFAKKLKYLPKAFHGTVVHKDKLKFYLSWMSSRYFCSKVNSTLPLFSKRDDFISFVSHVKHPDSFGEYAVAYFIGLQRNNKVW